MENNLNDIKKNMEVAKAIENDINEFRSYDMQGAYKKVEVRIRKQKHRNLYFKTFYRVASIVFLPLLLSTGILAYLYLKEAPIEQIAYHTVTSAPGVITQIELPDSSIVWLNAGSSLKYPSRFKDNQREVYLTGESYFQVKSDIENPFYVTMSNNMKVKAYGTAFNISSYEDDNYIETTLESGNVDIIISDRSFKLNPEEAALFDKKSNNLNVDRINIDEKTAWRKGQIIFRNKTIDEVAKVLSRRYNVDIVLKKQTNKQYRFRATFTNETINQILDYMKLAAPIDWSYAPTKQLPDSQFERQRIEILIK